MVRIGVEDRRARLGRRHRLGAGCQAADPVEAAASMVALHATDPATVHLSVAARVPGSEIAGTERALYDERSLIRMLGMRRTVFVVPTPFAPVVQAACTDDIAVKQRKLLVKHLAEAGVAADPVAAGRWLAAVEESTATALALRGSATAQELSADEPRLRTRLNMAAGKTYAAQPYVTSRVLFQLSADGRIVRGGRPGGRAGGGRGRRGGAASTSGRPPRNGCRAAWPSGRRRKRRGPSWRGRGCRRSALVRQLTCSGGPGGPPDRPRRRWLLWRQCPWSSTARSAMSCPAMRLLRCPSTRGSRSFPRWIRRRWDGRNAIGSWVPTSPSSSTTPATSAPRSGSTVASSAAGGSPSPARFATNCSKTSARTSRLSSSPKPPAGPPGSPASG